MKRVVINIRGSKNISGLVKFSVTSPAGLMRFFLNVEPCKISMTGRFFLGPYLRLARFSVPRCQSEPRGSIYHIH